MSVIQNYRFWAREDEPARAQLLAVLANMQVGDKINLREAMAQGAETGPQQAKAPPLVEYSTGVIPAHARAAAAAAAGGAGGDVELSFSSEEPYARWWGIEILGHKSGECDLSWMASGRAPFLSSHDTSRQIGVVLSAWLDPKTGRNRASVRFSRSQAAQEEKRDVEDGVRVNVSVGYAIDEMELVRKEGDTGVYRVTRWQPHEASLVAVPADMTVGIGRSVTEETPLLAPAPALTKKVTLPAQPRKEPIMSEPTTQPAQGDTAFRQHAAAIAGIAAQYGKYLKPGDESRAIADGTSAAQFQDLIMQRMASGATDATTLAGVGATPKEAKKYDFLRAIQSMIPGANIEAGLEREVSSAIVAATGRQAEGMFIPVDVMTRGLFGRGPGQKRDFTVATAAESGNLVQTDVASEMWTDVLRPAMALAAAGVTVLPGLRGNLAVPRKILPSTLGMLTEIALAAETQPNTALPVLTPKRISAFVDPSKQSIIQGEIGIEAMLRQDLIDGAAVLIDQQGLNGNGTAPNARGLRFISGIGSLAAGANGGNWSWPLLTGLEAAVANANANSTTRAGYIINTRTRNTSKNTQRAAGLPFMWDPGELPLNSYRTQVSNMLPNTLTKGTAVGVCSSAVFSSDWSMFVMGLFGGLDITVDPYTLAPNGQVRITLNQFFDFLCRQPGAFASVDDLLTS